MTRRTVQRLINMLVLTASTLVFTVFGPVTSPLANSAADLANASTPDAPGDTDWP